MKSPKRFGIGIALLLLASASLLWLWTARGSRQPAKPDPSQAKLQMLLASDRSLLQRQPPAPEAEQAAALLRLSQHGDSLARELSLKHAASASPALRQAAAAALASFPDPDALAQLLKLISDTQASVRVEALTALSRHPAPAARDAVLASLAKGGLTPAERAAAAGGALRLLPADHPEREAAILALVELAGNAPELTLQIQSVSDLSAHAPEHPRFLDLLRRILTTRKPAVLFPLAIQHLLSAAGGAPTDAPKVAASALDWVTDPDLAVRLAVVQTLHRSCPEARAQVLDKAVRSPGHAIQVAVIEQVDRMPIPAIRELARGWLAEKLIRDPALVARLELILKNTEGKPSDICAPAAAR